MFARTPSLRAMPGVEPGSTDYESGKLPVTLHCSNHFLQPLPLIWKKSLTNSTSCDPDTYVFPHHPNQPLPTYLADQRSCSHDYLRNVQTSNPFQPSKFGTQLSDRNNCLATRIEIASDSGQVSSFQAARAKIRRYKCL